MAEGNLPYWLALEYEMPCFIGLQVIYRLWEKLQSIWGNSKPFECLFWWIQRAEQVPKALSDYLDLGGKIDIISEFSSVLALYILKLNDFRLLENCILDSVCPEGVGEPFVIHARLSCLVLLAVWPFALDELSWLLSAFVSLQEIEWPKSCQDLPTLEPLNGEQIVIIPDC
jgi:hypothetical protein